MVVDWYEYPTNYSNGTSVNTPSQMFLGYPSLILGDYLGMGILTLMWLFIFVVGLVSGSKKAMLSASFITFIFSIFLARMQLVNPVVIMVLIVLTIVSLIGSKEEQGQL